MMHIKCSNPPLPASHSTSSPLHHSLLHTTTLSFLIDSWTLVMWQSDGCRHHGGRLSHLYGRCARQDVSSAAPGHGSNRDSRLLRQRTLRPPQTTGKILTHRYISLSNHRTDMEVFGIPLTKKALSKMYFLVMRVELVGILTDSHKKTRIVWLYLISVVFKLAVQYMIYFRTYLWHWLKIILNIEGSYDYWLHLYCARVGWRIYSVIGISIPMIANLFIEEYTT